MGKAKRQHNASDKNPLDKPSIRMCINEIIIPQLSIFNETYTTSTEEASNGSPSNQLITLSFLERIDPLETLTEQIKLCHEFKSKYKPLLLSKPLPKDADKNLFILFYMYLSPRYSPIRSSLDWLIDVSIFAIYEDCMPSIVCACNCVLKDMNTYLSTNPFQSISIPTIKDMAFSVLQMSLIDKICLWFDTPLPSSKSNSTPTYLSTSTALLQNCINALFPQNNSNTSMSVVTDSGIAYAEHSAECMKAFSMMLRTRNTLAYNHCIRDDCVETVNLILEAAFTLMKCELISRDVITSFAISIVSIQYAHRHKSEADTSTDLGAQLFALLHLTSLPNKLGSTLLYVDDATTGILPSISNALSTFPLTSRCEVFRASLSIYDTSQLLHQTSTQSPDNDTLDIDSYLLFGYAFNVVMSVASDSASTTRFAGLQMLETWINAVEQVEAKHPFDDDAQYCLSLRRKISSISGLLSLVWSHPHKLINHIVPVVYQRLVDYLSRSRVMHLSSTEVASKLILGDLIRDALAQPTHHRGRYQAINILLPKVSSDLLISSQPSVVSDLVIASSSRDVSSASTKLLGTLLKYLRDREGYNLIKVRSLWMEHVATVISSSSRKIRLASADYLVPEMLFVDSSCAPMLMNSIRELSGINQHKLFGLLSIVLQCRLQNLEGQAVQSQTNEDLTLSPSVLTIAPTGPLTISELQWGCVCKDVDIRLTALLLIVASQKSNASFNTIEFKLFKEYFPLSLKDSDADHRQRILRIVKMLVGRLKESLRVLSRDCKKLEEKIIYLTQTDDDNTTPEADANAAQIVLCKRNIDEFASGQNDVLEVLAWLSEVCLNNCFPGASFDREIMTLDMLCCIIETSERDALVLSALFSPALSKAVLNLFLSSWDKSRHLAADVMLKFPRPLPGYEDIASVNVLLNWAHALTGSARQRESDAGSQIIRVIYEVYCVGLNYNIRFDPLAKDTSSGVSSASIFYMDMQNVLENRINDVRIMFSTNESDSTEVSDLLCHGLILGIRYCMGSTIKCMRASNPDDFVLWKSIVKRSLSLAFEAMVLGVSVVAEAPSDVEFAPHLANALPTGASTLGPVNANSYMFLNTNSFFGATSIDNTEQDEDMSNKQLQRAVVGAWLLVKESSSLLSRLIEASVKLSEETGGSILDDEDIDKVGLSFIDSLGRLKHMGAISEVHSSLQKVAETLLRHGFSKPSLCSMPLKWLTILLDKLESKQQIFILRRSSGFAYSFLSLLRAEISDAKPLLLCIAMKKLLDCASEYVNDLELQVESDSLEGGVDGWRKSVHALNIIRLILLDSTLGPNLGPYISIATQIAVKGFKSSIWAIRNSSMMVFAAVVQRAVANEKNDFSNSHSCTPNDFFNNYPDLFPILLEELTAISPITQILETSNQQLNLLFPLLLFLSKMRPEIFLIDTEGNRSHDFHINLESFLAPIESCRGMDNMHVRSVAAKALKSFICIQNSPSYSLKIILELETQIQTSELSTNYIHGTLLLIIELIESVLSNINSLASDTILLQDTKDFISQQLLPTIEKLAFTTYSKLRFCPPILLAIFRIVKGCNSLVSTEASMRILWTHISFCLDNILSSKGSSGGQLFNVPYCPVLYATCLEELVALFFEPNLSRKTIILTTNTLLAFDSILLLLYHELAEVREGILDGLTRLLEISPEALISHNVFDALFKHLDYEAQPPLTQKCLELTSKMAYLVPSKSRVENSFSSHFYKLSSILFESKGSEILFYEYGLQNSPDILCLQSTDTACYAYELLIWYMRRQGNADSVLGFIKILQAAADDECPDMMRLAAASSWRHIETLVNKFLVNTSTYGIAICNLNIVAISLIQDDDEDVRAEMGKSLRQLQYEQNNSDESLVVDEFALNVIKDRLIEVFQNILNSSESSDVDVSNEIEILMCHYESFITDNEVNPTTENVVSKIFEEEVSNLFKEGRVVFECLGSAIADIIALLSNSNINNCQKTAHSSIVKVINKATMALTSYDEIRDTSGWLCDVTFRKDIFASLFGTTFLLHSVLSRVPLGSDVAQSLAVFVSFTTSGRNTSIHPLIYSNIESIVKCASRHTFDSASVSISLE